MAEEKKQGTPVQPATENGADQPQERQQAQQQPRPCPQDCRMCGTSQQVFCATKMIFDLSRRQQALEAAVAGTAKALADIQERMRKKDEAPELSIPFSE